MAFLVTHGANTADSSAVSVTGMVRPTDPFTKTGLTFNEVVTSTAEDWAGFYVHSAQTQYGIMTVWKGTVGSEVLVASMPLKNRLTAQDSFSMYVPVPIPSGTRLSVVLAGGSTTAVNEVQVAGIPSSNFSAEPSFTVMDCGPFLLSGGTALTYGEPPIIDAGGTANTVSSYVELSHTGGGNDANNVMQGNSLGSQYEYLGFLFGDGATAQVVADRLWTIGYGAAASEVEAITNLYDQTHTTETNLLKDVIWIPWGRAAGDRIAAKMQTTDTSATSRLGSVLMFGLR